MEAYSGDIQNAQYQAYRLYSVTHSSTYQDIMAALNTISPYALDIAGVLENPLISWMGLSWLPLT